MGKRGNERQITKDDCDEEEAPVEAGVFTKANAVQMNRRRIVKVKRQPNAGMESGPNPFAGVALTNAVKETESPAPTNEVPPAPTAEETPATTAASPEPKQQEAVISQTPTKTTTTTTTAPPADTAGVAATPQPAEVTAPNPTAAAAAAATTEPNTGSGFAAFAHSASPFKQLVSGGPAFGGAGGFAGVATNGHQKGAFGGEANWPSPGEKSLFSSDTKQVTTTPAPVSSQQQKVTGEEEEETLFNHEATLYALVGSEWKQRGKGDLRVNCGKNSGGRLIMRQKVTLRLFLNAGIYQGMKVTKMNQNSVTFSCVNGADEIPPAKEGEPPKEEEGDKATATTTPSTDKGTLKVYALRFLVKGEVAEMLMKQFEKAVEDCSKKATEKSGN